MVRIDIKSLKPGIYEYDWALEAEALELDPEVFKALQVEARVDYQPTQVFIKLKTLADASLVCDRTLVTFEQSVEGAYSILFTAAEMHDEGGAADEDVRQLRKEDEELDITDVVRDTFILSLPQRRIAPGAEDEDIQLQFGASSAQDAEMDPRWEALKKLRSSPDSQDDS